MTDQLLKLCSRCKHSVTLTVNDHRDYYESVHDLLESHYAGNSNSDYTEDIEKDVLDKMIEANTVIYLQFYPDTATTFYRIYHYDLKMALDIAIETLEKHDKR